MLITSLPLRNNIKGIFFDLDGTLEDTAGGVLATIKFICDRYNIPYAGDQKLRPYAGEGLVYLMRLCEPNLDDEILHEGFANGLMHYRQEAYKYNTLFDGVKEILTIIEQQGLVWGIVTNKLRSIVKTSLDNFPFLPSADLIICQDDLPKHKPDPMPLVEIAKRSNLLPSESIYVGDSLTDMIASNAAGMHGIFVTYGYGHYQKLKTSNVKASKIDHLSELKKWLISIS